jgi:uncharacterized membrane protein
MDGIWLGLIAKDFYFNNLSHLLRENFNALAGGIFYLMYIAGVLYFAVLPALEDNSLRKALINGVILGLIAYGTYDMTNYAVTKDFPLKVALVDWLWGGIVTGSTATAAFYITRYFVK